MNEERRYLNSINNLKTTSSILFSEKNYCIFHSKPRSASKYLQHVPSNPSLSIYYLDLADRPESDFSVSLEWL